MRPDKAGAAGHQNSHRSVLVLNRVAPDRVVSHFERLHQIWIIQVPAHRDHRLLQAGLMRWKLGCRNSFHSVKISSASAPSERLVVGFVVGDAIAKNLARILERFGIVHAALRAGLQQFLDHHQRGSLAHVVGARLKGQSPNSKRAAGQIFLKCCFTRAGISRFWRAFTASAARSSAKSRLCSLAV